VICDLTRACAIYEVASGQTGPQAGYIFFAKWKSMVASDPDLELAIWTAPNQGIPTIV
jgi:hypothetical protein